MYKIIDIQGGGMMLNDIFKTKKSIIDRLAGYHDSDFEGQRINGQPYANIHEWLYEMKDEDERLNALLEWGQWELEELPERTTDVERDNHN